MSRAVGERTQVVVPLGVVVGAVLSLLSAILLAFGGWLWRVQEMVYSIREDVAVIKAAAPAHVAAEVPASPRTPAAPIPPIALADATPTARFREGFHR